MTTTTQSQSCRRELLAMLCASMSAGPVRLASGKMSDFYIDGRLTSLSGRGLLLIGEAFYELLRDERLEAVGGPTLGADPIVAAVAQTFALKGASLNAFIIRKEPKSHGTEKWTEGPPLREGGRVAILEDVCTSGGSAVRAIDNLRKQYAPHIALVSCLVDRGEGAAELFAERGIPFKPLFTRADFGK